jgi:glycosyltransferase involved in cell wall biosynthesis
MAGTRRRRILVVAFACAPGRGSEPGAGWTWTLAACQHHDVWLLTSSHQRAALEAGLAEHRPDGLLGVRYVEDDVPSLERSISLRRRRRRDGTTRYRGNSQLHYWRWQRAARRSARALHQEHDFDLAHHLSWGVDWQPTAAAGVPGLPYVWGPVGGAAPPAWGVARWLGVRGTASEVLRELVTRPLRRLVGRPLARGAALVVAQNGHEAAAFAGLGPVVVAPHPALDPRRLAELAAEHPSPAPPAGRRRAVLCGRLLPWKGAHLAVAAIAQAPGWQLDVYGGGPARAGAERRAARLGISDRVTFHGGRPWPEVLGAVAGADALLHPAIHDSSPWIVAEAVTLGTPVVCLDSGGTPEIARVPEGGRAVPVDRRAPAALAAALDQLPALEPVDWWDLERLPGQLEHLYDEALAHDGSGTAPGARVQA